MLIAISLLALVFSANATADDLFPSVYYDFDGHENFEFSNANDSNAYVNGFLRKGILLSDQCLSLSLDKYKISDQATILFWFKPNWGYYQNKSGDLISHSFLSMKWKNGGYMVLSDGWWESKGGGVNTYFILNNKDLSNARSKITYIKDQWVHIAISWDAEKGRLRLYKNGEIVSEKINEFMVNEYLDELFVGCDKGTTIYGQRFMDGILDELKIYNTELSQEQVVFQSDTTQQEFAELKYKYLDHFEISTDDELRTPENRIVFDSYPASWQTKAQARKTMKRLYDAGINVYIPSVWYGDGARFDSKIAPHAAYKGNGKPLKYLIEIAHQYGIEVHPWLTVAYRSKNILPSFFEDGTPPKAFEVHSPEFRDFIVNLVSELVDNYDIDGINLDYIRTMGVSKSKLAEKLYRDKYKEDLLNQLHKLDKNQAWSKNVQDFINYPIDEIVSRVSQVVRKTRPDIILSVDGHPSPSFLGESRQGRNEIKWLNNGLIDIVFAMNYSMEIDYSKIDLLMNELDDPKKVIVLLGLFDKDTIDRDKQVDRHPIDVEKLIHYSRSKWNNGIALYPYSMMSIETHSLLRNELFKYNVGTKWPN